MAEQFRVMEFKSPRGAWRASHAEALRDAVELGLGAYDEHYRATFLDPLAWIETRKAPAVDDHA